MQTLLYVYVVIDTQESAVLTSSPSVQSKLAHSVLHSLESACQLFYHLHHGHPPEPGLCDSFSAAPLVFAS